MADSLADIDRKLGYLSREAPGILGRAALAGVKAMVPAIRAAARAQIRQTPQGKVSVRRGGMERSINAARMKKVGGLIGAKVGIDVGKGKGVKRSGHGHLFISGTVRRDTGSVRIRQAGKVIGRKSTGNPVQNRGIMPAHLPSFVTAGAKSSEAAMKAAFAETLTKGIAAAMEKGV